MFRPPDEKKAIFKTPPKKGQSSDYIGKIGVIGTGGAGKTRALIALSNSAARKKLYHWNEAKEIFGTTTIQPYSLQLSHNVILIDNPGQNSLEHLRKTVALSGERYQGLLIFLDAIGWNFWQVGIQQARTILSVLDNQQLPISLVVSKWDLQRRLLGNRSQVDDLARIIMQTISDIKPGSKLPYYDRINNKVNYIPFNNQKTIPFTQLEQILVNGIDKYTISKPIQGLTRVNTRLLVRSLLLGYCNLFRKYMTLPDFAKEHPELIIEDNVVYSLNYYRPTAFETETTWIKMAGNPKAIEPPILLEMFKFANIVDVFKREVICPSLDILQDYVNKLGEDLNIVSQVASNIINKDSTEKIITVIQDLIQHKSFIPVKKDKKNSTDDSLTKHKIPLKHKLPPKPKPIKWSKKH